jgi:formylglycine-generating enzyme required for sulfatase activity
MRFVRIPAGEFQMGSTPEEKGHVSNEAPRHLVRITRDFEMGVHEVTNGQFRAFVEATGYETEAERDVGGGFGIDFERAVVVQDPRHNWRDPGFPAFAPGDEHPVLMISWNDAEAFCRWLSEEEGRVYRLPTEAEWEYAARGGTATPWWTGHDPHALATAANTAEAALRGRVPKATWAGEWNDGFPFLAPVGSFEANPFGLHDITGNVWEWCLDWYQGDYYASSPTNDPQGPETGTFRTIRGGGWFNDAAQNRSAQRIYFEPTFRYCLLSGFRVVRELP